MAENESLDLRDPGGQRWRHVHDAVKKQLSPEEVAHRVTRKLPQALKKTIKEFAESGVTVEELLANRNDRRQLDRLVRKCQGHEYARLFADTAAAELGADNRQLLTSFFNGVIDRVFDQISQDVVGSAAWPNLAGIRDHLAAVQKHAAPDVNRIASKLATNPGWLPTVRSNPKTESDNPTQSLLGMSLLKMGDK